MSNIKNFIEENLDSRSDDPFFVFNVEDVIQQHKKWLKLLPRVVPYYAVKANRFPLLLEIMKDLGLKFDCASQFEMEDILSRGVQPEDIIIANPSKSVTFLEHSKKNKVDLMTFDGEEELVKINSVYPSARLVLRIKVDDKNSSVKLGLKFGADLQTVDKLLKRAKNMKMNLIGIAFHVGSSCQSTQSYLEGLQISRNVFDKAIKMGFPISLLDIGGGFPGSQHLYYEQITENVCNFEEIARVINKSLDNLFPEQHLTIIGEPGRYYCESVFTLVTKIISKNVTEINGEKTIMYYLNDGIYASFLDHIIDRKIYYPVPFLNNHQIDIRKDHKSILWGPTCDSGDCIREDFLMVEMNIGEWLVFNDMGSYSLPYTKFGFNGMPSPNVKIFVSQSAENQLLEIKVSPKLKSYLADIKCKNIYEESVCYKMG